MPLNCTWDTERAACKTASLSLASINCKIISLGKLGLIAEGGLNLYAETMVGARSSPRLRKEASQVEKDAARVELRSVDSPHRLSS